MAEGTARSVDRPDITPEQGPRSRLRLVARNDEAPRGRAPALPVVAPEERAAPVLSPAANLLGIGPAGWIGASLLYAGLIAALLLVGFTVKPPEPWPENKTVFRVIFEPAPTPAPPAPPAAAPEPPKAAAAPPPPEPAPPKPAPAPPPPIAAAPPRPAEPAPSPIAAAPPPPPAKPAPPPVASAPPSAEPLPAPPPPKPVRRHAQAKPHPSRAEAPASRPAPQRSAGERRVAALPPPSLPLLPPRPISAAAGNPKPVYPASARRRGLQGRVVLHVEVSAQGAATGVTVLTSSGHSILDKAALRAVAEWRFIPASRGGTPVAAGVNVPIQFRLEE